MRFKHIFLGLLLCSILFSTPAVQAGDPLMKLGRGVANIVFSPFELLIQPYDMAHEEGNIAGVTAGVFYGIFFTVSRIVVGAADVVTFLIPLPGYTDNKYDTGWGYGPMAFHDNPWVFDVEHNWGNFFYDTEDMVSDRY